MTQTLDGWHVLGDPQPVPTLQGARTVDFDALLSRSEALRAERTLVRNVLVLDRRDVARPLKARAAFDAIHRSLISWLPTTEGQGDRDVAEASLHFVEC